MKAINAVAQILKREGTEQLFCYPYNNLIDACAEVGIPPIMARNERAALGMADGYARVLNGRKPAVCGVQYGPGVENSFSGVAHAYADSSPLLFLPLHIGRGRLGSTRNFSAGTSYRPITKWSEQFPLPERVPDMLRRAFANLRNGRLGPVLLEMPQDVMAGEVADDFAYKAPQRARAAGDPEAVRAAVKALLAAKSPLLYVGQGTLYAEAWDELHEFAELAGAPVMTTLLGKSAFREDHPLSIGSGCMQGATGMIEHFRQKADLVFGLGTSFSKEWMRVPIADDKSFVQVTNDDRELDADRALDVAVLGDARLVLRQLIEELRKQAGEGGRDRGGVEQEIAAVKKGWLAEWMPKLTADEAPINPYRVIWDLMHTVDRANTIITPDSGNPRDELVPFWETLSPRGFLGYGNSTPMGASYALALGAKVARPEKTVINITGDASFGMVGMEIATAARHNLGVLTIVLNNQAMANFDKFLPVAVQRYDFKSLNTNCAAVAAGLGAASERVEEAKEIVPAIKRALEATKSGRPALVEVMTKEETAVPKWW